MGFWSSLWGGIKSIGRGISKAVSWVGQGVKKVVQGVGTAVKYVAGKVNDCIEWVSDKITKVKDWCADKINRAKNWFFEETSLGRALKKGYNYIMDETFIGQGIRWVGGAIQRASNWFFRETPVGRFIGNAASAINNSFVGKILNIAQPLLPALQMTTGFAGALICKGVGYLNTANSWLGNPAGMVGGWASGAATGLLKSTWSATKTIGK